METWHAVLHAPGFPGGFIKFASDELGIVIPHWIFVEDIALVKLVADHLKHLQSQWEYQLAKARAHSHRLFLNDDWNRGGRVHASEIKPPPKPEISMLDLQEFGQVARLRHSKTGPFWVVAQTMPAENARSILCNGDKYPILHREGYRIQLERPIPGPQARVPVVFLTPTSDVAQINQLTLQFWEQYWQGPDEPDISDIQEILRTIPSIPMFNEICSVEEIQEAISCAKPARARGPNNWSNEDLKNMPGALVSQLTDLFNLFLQQKDWPKCLLEATVALLPKEKVVQGLDETRPITVLSAVYRIWSRVVTRKFLQNSHVFLPSSIQGNRQRASSMWLASHVQLQLENGLWFGLECNVASVDLKKHLILSRDYCSGVQALRSEFPLVWLTFTRPFWVVLPAVSGLLNKFPLALRPIGGYRRDVASRFVLCCNSIGL